MSYSCDKLAAGVDPNRNAGNIAGAIRDLRDKIVEVLCTEANITCWREDVILSRGQGYRLEACITVQDGDRPEITGIRDMDDTSDVRNVRDQDVPNVHNEDESDDAAGRRRTWILERLDEKHELQAPAVAKQFECSVKTALKDEGKIEFVGAARTGH